MKCIHANLSRDKSGTQLKVLHMHTVQPSSYFNRVSNVGQTVNFEPQIWVILFMAEYGYSIFI